MLDADKVLFQYVLMLEAQIINQLRHKELENGEALREEQRNLIKFVNNKNQIDSMMKLQREGEKDRERERKKSSIEDGSIESGIGIPIIEYLVNQHSKSRF